MLLDVNARCAVSLIKHRRTDVVDLQVLNCLRKDVSCQEAPTAPKVNTVFELFLDIEESIREAESNFFFNIIVSVDVFTKTCTENIKTISLALQDIPHRRSFFLQFLRVEDIENIHFFRFIDIAY